MTDSARSSVDGAGVPPAATAAAAASSFLDGLGMPVFAVDCEGRVAQWNAELSARTGRDGGDVVRRNFADLLHDGGGDGDGRSQRRREQRIRWEAALAACLAHQDNVNGTNSKKGATGNAGAGASARSSSSKTSACEVSLTYRTEHSFFPCRIKLVRQSEGAVVTGAVCFVEELVSETVHPETTSKHDGETSTSSTTSDRDAHSPLHAAARDNCYCGCGGGVHDFVRQAGLPVIGVDLRGNVNLWNPRATELTGIAERDAVGRSLADVLAVPPERRDDVNEVLQRAFSGTGTSNCQFEVVSESGETLYWLVNVSPLRRRRNNCRDVEGAVDGAVLFAQDVTEAARHDRVVAEYARELRLLIDTASSCIFGVDLAGNVNEWNSKMADVTGFGPDDAFHKKFVDTFISLERRDSMEHIMKSAVAGNPITNSELEIQTKDGDTRLLLVSATARRDADDEIVGVVGIAQDVTEAAKHNGAIEAVSKELRQLINTANAPIFGIDCDGYVCLRPWYILSLY